MRLAVGIGCTVHKSSLLFAELTCKMQLAGIFKPVQNHLQLCFNHLSYTVSLVTVLSRPRKCKSISSLKKTIVQGYIQRPEFSHAPNIVRMYAK